MSTLSIDKLCDWGEVNTPVKADGYTQIHTVGTTMPLTEMTFFERFEADILSGKKTITIRDESEKNFKPNTLVQVSTFETKRWFCELMIKEVQPIAFEQLSQFHAEQENMSLKELKHVIRDIYPNVNQFYVISYALKK